MGGALATPMRPALSMVLGERPSPSLQAGGGREKPRAVAEAVQIEDHYAPIHTFLLARAVRRLPMCLVKAIVGYSDLLPPKCANCTLDPGLVACRNCKRGFCLHCSKFKLELEDGRFMCKGGQLLICASFRALPRANRLTKSITGARGTTMNRRRSMLIYGGNVATSSHPQRSN